MAKQDFCFTYYDGDATRDMAHMNRLERGCYTDLIISQRKFGAMPLAQIRKILGKDFDECWPSIEVVMEKDGENYHIEWLTNSIIKMRAQSRKQSANGKKGGRPFKTDESETQLKTKANPNKSKIKPLGTGDGNGNEYVLEKGSENETPLIVEMGEIWKLERPDYPFDETRDYEHLKSIADFMLKQAKVKGQYNNPDIRPQLLTVWRSVAQCVHDDKHYQNYTIEQVNKYFSGIVISAKGGKKSGKINGQQLNKAFAQFYSKA